MYCSAFVQLLLEWKRNVALFVRSATYHCQQYTSTEVAQECYYGRFMSPVIVKLQASCKRQFPRLCERAY